MTIFDFFDSNLFQTLITFLVGLFIFIVYSLRKKDDKRKRAMILCLEIKNAEKKVDNLKNIPVIDGSNNFININSVFWMETKNYFINDLGIDEIENMDSFFNRCFYIQNLWDEFKKLSIEKEESNIIEKKKLIGGQIGEHSRAIRYITSTTGYEKLKKIAKIK